MFFVVILRFMRYVMGIMFWHTFFKKVTFLRINQSHQQKHNWD